MATNPGIEPVVSVEMGNAGDALDYALDHLETMLDKTDFLEAWREGDLRDYPGYLTWVAFQHRCAAESKAARPSQPPVTDVERVAVNDIAVMMSEFVDNWPQPKRLSTALALIAKTLRAALDNPPKHRFWGAGEQDCPRDIKAGNGELHTLRCKVCGQDNPRNETCRAAIAAMQSNGEG